MDEQNEPSAATPRYTVTVYLAYPGTPLKHEDSGYFTGQTSAAGHMWYEIWDGATNNSYGFAPKEEGVSSGPGEVGRTDTDTYHQPGYSRTLEISAEQYQRLKQFGEDGVDEHWNYFRSDYRGLTNSCIDFAWGALDHAGIERQRPVRTTGYGEFSAHDQDTPVERGFDGAVKVMSNQRHLQQLVPPMPDSELNQEQSHPAPERSLQQRLLTENGPDRNDIGPVGQQLLTDSEREVRQVADRHGLPWDQGLSNTCYAMAATARQCGMTGVNLFRTDGQHIQFGQYEGYILREAELGAWAAANTPQAHSEQSLAEMEQQHSRLAEQPWQHHHDSARELDLQQPGRGRG